MFVMLQERSIRRPVSGTRKLPPFTAVVTMPNATFRSCTGLLCVLDCFLDARSWLNLRFRGVITRGNIRESSSNTWDVAITRQSNGSVQPGGDTSRSMSTAGAWTKPRSENFQTQRCFASIHDQVLNQLLGSTRSCFAIYASHT